MSFNVRIPPPPLTTEDKSVWSAWYVSIVNAISRLSIFPHNDLEGLQGGNTTERYHFTSAQHTDLTDGGASTLHYHASDRDSANFTGTNWTDLTDAGDSALHYHSSDRARANHTGTQLLSTISDVTATSTEVNYIDGVTSALQPQIDAKAPLASPTFTGTLTAPTIVSTTVMRLKGYTVATLPAGTQGDKAFVTDALGPTYLVTVIGGGAVVTEVFYNGTNWVCT